MSSFGGVGSKKVMSGIVESGVSMSQMKSQTSSQGYSPQQVGLAKSAERMHYDKKPSDAHVTAFDGKTLFASDFKSATKNQDGSMLVGGSTYTAAEYKDLKTQFNNEKVSYQNRHDEWYTTAWRNGWIAGSPFERDVPRQ